MLKAPDIYRYVQINRKCLYNICTKLFTQLISIVKLKLNFYIT